MFVETIARHQLFFAIRPSIEVARRGILVGEDCDGALRPLHPEHLHVTVDMLDDLPRVSDALLARLEGAGDAVAAAPFEIVLDRIAGSPRSIALRPSHANPALEDLRRAIAAQRIISGITGRQGYAFQPHMTLGYRGGVPFNRRIEPLRWRVVEFVLIHSHLGATRHETMKRWTLDGTRVAQMDLFA